jgi:hypothetical protein
MKVVRRWWVFTLALAFLAMFACATAMKWCWNVYTSPVMRFLPSYTAKEARERGTLVCRFSVTPKKFIWNNGEFEYKEVWVEEATQLEHFLVWFPYYKRLGWNHVCFKISDQADARLQEIHSFPRFALLGKKQHFSYHYPMGPNPHGTGVFLWEGRETLDFSTLQIVVVSPSEEQVVGPFTLQRE